VATILIEIKKPFFILKKGLEIQALFLFVPMNAFLSI